MPSFRWKSSLSTKQKKKPFHWVDKCSQVLYINLEKRKDRQMAMETLLKNDLLIPEHKVVRIDAIEHQPGFIGCTKSHLKALQVAIDNHYPYVCLMEDDLQLQHSPSEFHRQVNEAWQKLHGNFDILFLAMTPIKLKPVFASLPNFHQVQQALAMPALIVKQSYYPTLKSIYTEALTKGKPHDLITQLYQKHHYWYGFFPPIASQRPGYSDIEEKEVDYRYLELDGQMIQKN